MKEEAKFQEETRIVNEILKLAKQSSSAGMEPIAEELTATAKYLQEFIDSDMMR
jgi:hypothetical protein